MSFLNPTYLWALLGLVIPVAIHLWSNKEGRTIKIGSVKFLSASDVKQTNSVKLNELLLLLLRMLIITLLVFILAEPIIKGEEDNVSITYLIEPSLLKNEKLSPLIDSLKQNSEIRLLQTGFPELDTNKEENSEFPTPNYWQLAEEMQELRTDSIVVFTEAYLQGFKGKRPLLDRNIEWIVLDSEAEGNEILEVVQKEDEVEVLELLSNQQNSSFKKYKLPLNNNAVQLNQNKDSLRFVANKEQVWHPLKVEDSLKVLIFYEEEFEATKVYLESSFIAISKYLERPITVDAVQDTTDVDWNGYNYQVWLSATSGSKLSIPSLVFVSDSLSNSLIEPTASPNTLHLTKLLTTENIISENLVEQLLKFLDLNKDLENKVETLDKRTLDLKQLTTGYSEAVSKQDPKKSLSISKWFWLALFLLLITERIFARYRKQ